MSPAHGSRCVPVVGRKAWQTALTRLTRNAKWELSLLSHHLEAFAYGDVEFVAAVKELILDNRRAQVRVLVNDVGSAAKGHRLVDLGRTLSSFIQFRQLQETDRDTLTDLLIADRSSFLERLDPDSFKASEYLDAPADTRSRVALFEQLWARAVPSPELRALFI